MTEQPERRRGAPLDPAVLVGSTDTEILQGFVRLVRTARGGSLRRPLPLRDADVAALVAILGTDSAEVERRLVAATACSPSVARHGRRLLLAGVGVLALGLVAAPLTGEASTAQVAVGRPDSRPSVVPSSIPNMVASAILQGASVAEQAEGVDEMRAPSAAPAIPQGAPVVEQAAGMDQVPAASTVAMVPAGAEAILAIASVGIELPVVLGGQAVIDQGLVAHYTAPGWEEPVAAGARGTYWLAAHATTHGAPFRSLPDVTVGAEIRLNTADQSFVYTVTSMQVTGLWPGDDLMYGTDPTASIILLQTCIDDRRRLLVHGTLTATS